MVMGGNGGDATAWGGGFAARASRRETDEGPAAGSVGGGRTGYGTPRGGASAAASMPAAAADRAKPAMPKPRKGDTVRVKRLATIVAASVALTAVSVSYGVWSAAASRAAVEHATAGALPTLVAAADIRAGDAITAEAVTVQDVPATYRAASALGGEALDAEGLAAGGRAIVDIPAGTQLSSSFVTGMGGDRLSAELGAGLQAVTLAVDVETGLAGAALRHGAHRVCGGRVGRRGVPRDGVRARPRRCGGRRCNQRAERFRLRHGGSVARGG